MPWHLVPLAMKIHALLLQGTINVDRFYNLLPFVNRMPRNQFYAHLSSRVAGRCMNSWSTGTLFGAKSGTNGVFAPG